MKTFAQISGGVCVAITQAAVKPIAINGDLIVELQAYDVSYLGRSYADGAWA
jgi:hypothetical protein